MKVTAATTARPSPPPTLGTFTPLPEAKFERLLRKGARDAQLFAAAIRSQFELSAEDARQRLR